MSNALCRICNLPLTKVVDFGMQPLGNGFIEEVDIKDEYFFKMEIGYSEESMMLQLINQPDPEKMFHDHYAFYSSTSNFMIEHFKNFYRQIIQSKYIAKDDPFIVELGCNDGILLKNFSNNGFRHLGIEPSLNVAKEASKNGVKTCSEFFTEKLAKKIVDENGKADLFFAANVMCHIPNILDVVKGIKRLIKAKGVCIFEDPYLGDIISKTSYDQIYDEHVFLFSALSIQFLFGLCDMDLIDVEAQKTHGGSMRYTLAHKGAYPINKSVDEIIKKERLQGLDRIETFHQFRVNIESSKLKLINLLQKLKDEGNKVVGYAATSKSTTILNFCNIGPDLIDYICDTTPIKQGKLSPGMHIPIVPYEEFKNNPPKFAFLFAWNHADEILEKEKNFYSLGGKWIVHVPEVKFL